MGQNLLIQFLGWYTNIAGKSQLWLMSPIVMIKFWPNPPHEKPTNHGISSGYGLPLQFSSQRPSHISTSRLGATAPHRNRDAPERAMLPDRWSSPAGEPPDKAHQFFPVHRPRNRGKHHGKTMKTMKTPWKNLRWWWLYQFEKIGRSLDSFTLIFSPHTGFSTHVWLHRCIC